MTKEEFEYYANLNTEELMETLQQVKEMMPLYGETFESANILEATVGTTGYKGGDTGHGGRTLFRLSNRSCTDMRVSVNSGVLKNADEVTIVFGGDCELDTFKKALRFALRTLEKQAPEMSLFERIKCACKYRDLSWLRGL